MVRLIKKIAPMTSYSGSNCKTFLLSVFVAFGYVLCTIVPLTQIKNRACREPFWIIFNADCAR